MLIDENRAEAIDDFIQLCTLDSNQTFDMFVELSGRLTAMYLDPGLPLASSGIRVLRSCPKRQKNGNPESKLQLYVEELNQS